VPGGRYLAVAVECELFVVVVVVVVVREERRHFSVCMYIAVCRKRPIQYTNAFF
jgi:hypothetical protein